MAILTRQSHFKVGKWRSPTSKQSFKRQQLCKFIAQGRSNCGHAVVSKCCFPQSDCIIIKYHSLLILSVNSYVMGTIPHVSYPKCFHMRHKIRHNKRKERTLFTHGVFALFHAFAAAGVRGNSKLKNKPEGGLWIEVSSGSFTYLFILFYTC